MPEQQDPQPQQQPPAPVYGPPPPGTPYSQPMPSGPPRGGLGTGAIVGIVAGGAALLLVLLIALGAGAFSLISRTFDRPMTPVPTPQAPLVGAEEAVEDYLTALAEGDADAALQYVWVYEEETLLTDEVLAGSLERAPITDIEVGEAERSGPDAFVPVSFRIGDEAVDRTFEVWGYSDDWEIADGLIYAGFSQFEGLDLTVNGVPAGSSTSLFPGSYELAIEDEYFEIPPEDGLVTFAYEEDGDELYALNPVVTEEAAETFRTLVRESLEECLAMTSLTTPCGLDVPAITDRGERAVEGTVRRELTPEGEQALDDLVFERDYWENRSVTAWDYIPTRVTAQLGDERDAYVSASYLLYPLIDLDAAKLTVRWVE